MPNDFNLQFSEGKKRFQDVVTLDHHKETMHCSEWSTHGAAVLILQHLGLAVNYINMQDSALFVWCPI